MPNPLVPTLSGTRVTVSTVLNDTRFIEGRISAVAERQTLLDKFFTADPRGTTNGGLLYTVMTAADMFTVDDIEPRMPGAEYRKIQPVRPEQKLALVTDYGGEIDILDEERMRNRIRDVEMRTVQAANKLVRKLDLAALAAIESADIADIVYLENWKDLKFVGPADQITPSNQRPSAHFGEAQLAATLEELDVVHNLAIMHPQQLTELQTAYGADLAEMLNSMGLSTFANPRITEGTIYMVERGACGVVAFETPLHVERIDDRKRKKTTMQFSAVPAFAVDRPYACKKIILAD